MNNPKLIKDFLEFHTNLLLVYDKITKTCIDHNVNNHNIDDNAINDIDVSIQTGFGLEDHALDDLDTALTSTILNQQAILTRYNEQTDMLNSIMKLTAQLTTTVATIQNTISSNKSIIFNKIDDLEWRKERIRQEKLNKISITDWTIPTCINPLIGFLSIDRINRDFGLCMNYMNNDSHTSDDTDAMYDFLANSKTAHQYYNLFIPKLCLISLEFTNNTFDIIPNANININYWGYITCNQIASACLFLLTSNRELFDKFIMESIENRWNTLELKYEYLLFIKKVNKSYV